MLPTSQSPGQLSVMPIQPAVNVVDSLSAIGKLQALVRDGTLSSAQITGMLYGVPDKTAQAQAAQADDAASLANADLQIRPAQTDFSLAKLASEKGLIQPRAAADLSNLKFSVANDASKTATLPSSTDATIAQNTAAADTAPGGALAKESADANTVLSNKQAAALLKLSPEDAEVLSVWKTRHPGERPPMAGEIYDTAKMHGENAEFNRVNGYSGKGTLWDSPRGTAAIHTAQEYGRLDLLSDQNGNRRPLVEVERDLASTGKAPTDADAKKASADLRLADRAQTTLAQARAILDKSDAENIVGPVAGSMVGKASNYIKAASHLGSPAGRDDQARLTQTLALQILEAQRTLGGRAMAAGFKIESAAQPKLSDSKEVWVDWLNRTQEMIDAARQSAAAELKRLPPDRAGMYPTGGPEAATPTATGQPVLVRTQSDYAQLPVGTPYVDVNGRPGVKK